MGKADLKAKFLEGFKTSFGQISNTCLSLKIDRTTFYNWMDKDEDFRKAIETLKGSFVEFVESKVKEKINSGSDYWLKEWLRTHSSEWRGPEVEATGKIELTLNRHIMGDSSSPAVSQSAATTENKPESGKAK